MNVFKVALCLILVSCYPVHLFVANFAATVQENQGRGKNEASMVFCETSVVTVSEAIFWGSPKFN